MFFQRLRRWMLWVPGMIILLAVVVFSYGYIKKIPEIYGILYPNASAREADESKDNKEVIGKSNPLILVAAKTVTGGTLKLERFYSDCGHTFVEEHPMEGRYIGKTEVEFSALFPLWQLKAFTSDQAKLWMEIKGYCPDHYLIREEDGYLLILRSDKDTGIPLIVESIEISLDSMSNDLIEQIREGIVLDSIEEVELLLENLES